MDGDCFRIYIDKPGVLTVNLYASTEARGSINLFDSDWTGTPKASGNNQLKYIVPKQGYYYIYIGGYSGNGSAFWEFTSYTYNTSFCPMPVTMDILAGSDNVFCEGGSVTLTATPSFNQYKWYKDGSLLNNTTNQIVATESGTYRAEGFKCERSVSSANFVNVIVKQLPPKPVITKEEQPDKFILTSNSTDGNQWYLNGNIINGAISKTYLPEQFGAYSVKVTQNNCSSQSEVTQVKMDKPSISHTGPTTFFEGDSIVLTGPAGYSGYKWTLDDSPLSNGFIKYVARKSGNYKLAIQRGKLSSDFSDPVNVIVNPILSVRPNQGIPVNLYPNPNKGTFWIELPENNTKWQVEVYDILGKKLLQKAHSYNSRNRENIELKAGPGTYFLKIITDQTIQTLKFVIEP